MKRTLFFFLLAIVALTGCNSKEKVSDPKDIGPQAMTILEQMNELTRPEFAEYFITWNELDEIILDKIEVEDEEQRRSLLLPTKGEIKVRYNFMHRRLKAEGRRNGINWDKIEFVSFTHETKMMGDVKFCYGLLTFKYRSAKYNVQTTSIYDGSHYILTSLANINNAR